VNRHPVILFIPGLRPKPPPEIHLRELRRCLLEGVARNDPDTARAIRSQDRALDIVGWTFDFYGEHRDIEPERAGIERVLRQHGPTAADKAEAATLKHRVVRWIYRAADRLPFLVPQVADERLQLHLNDLRRYVTNDDEIADATRRLLKVPLRAAWRAGRPTLLIAHSMGSVIAYDALWQLSRESDDDLEVDLITLGSPLGQRHIQRRLLGCNESGERRYPDNIRNWINIAAYGEMTAIDMGISDDFAEMLRLGLVDRLEDAAVYNYFRLNGQLNVHSEYGYLINEVTATYIRDWWLEATSADSRSLEPGRGPIRQDRGSA
jgi:hypothetical protein